MKIVISFDDRVRPDTTGHYFKRGFEKLLGQSNVVYTYHENLPQFKSSDADLFIKIDDGLMDNKWLNPNLHPSMYYLIDTHLDPEWRQEMVKESNFDYLFFAQQSGLKFDWQCSNLFWVPLGAETESHYFKEPIDKKYDVGFIGNIHSTYGTKRVDYLDTLFKTYPEFYFGKRFGLDMAQKFKECRIVFNNAMNKDINMRFFEAQCSGSALLTDRINPDMNQLGFKEGTHYIGYDTKEEMIDKAKFYLQHVDLREEIADNGKEFVQEKHQYIHRCEEILKTVNKSLVRS